MLMDRHLANVQRVGFRTTALPLGNLAAAVRGAAAAQVGQGETGLPVAAISGPQQREERLILVDGEYLPVAEGPAAWRKVNPTILISARKGSDIQALLRHAVISTV